MTQTWFEPDQLADEFLTHYGITPERLEWKGVETIYQRV